MSGRGENRDKEEEREMVAQSGRNVEVTLFNHHSSFFSSHTTHICLNDKSLANEPTGRQTGNDKSNKAIIRVLQEP